MFESSAGLAPSPSHANVLEGVTKSQFLSHRMYSLNGFSGPGCGVSSGTHRAMSNDPQVNNS